MVARSIQGDKKQLRLLHRTIPQAPVRPGPWWHIDCLMAADLPWNHHILLRVLLPLPPSSSWLTVNFKRQRLWGRQKGRKWGEQLFSIATTFEKAGSRNQGRRMLVGGSDSNDSSGRGRSRTNQCSGFWRRSAELVGIERKHLHGTQSALPSQAAAGSGGLSHNGTWARSGATGMQI